MTHLLSHPNGEEVVVGDASASLSWWVVGDAFAREVGDASASLLW